MDFARKLPPGFVEKFIKIFAGKLALISIACLYFVCQFIYLMPRGTAPEPVVRISRDLLTMVGMTDKWNMFAPEPRTINLDTEALITFSDGSRKICVLSDLTRDFSQSLKSAIEGDPGWHRFSNEKLRKLLVERLPCSGSRSYLPDVARFVARRYADPENRPVRVELYCQWGAISGPDVGYWVRPSKHPSLRDRHVLIDYPVTAGDLVSCSSVGMRI